jgi:hypothetical protein
MVIIREFRLYLFPTAGFDIDSIDHNAQSN